MELIYQKGRVRLYYMQTEKFKTDAVSVSFCAPLQKENAYRNALIPMILNRGSRTLPTTKEMTRHLMGLYGAGFSVDVDKKGEIQLIQFHSDFASPKYAGNCPDIAAKISRFMLDLMTDPKVVASPEGDSFDPDYFEQERTNADQFIRAEINDKQSYAMRRCVESMCEQEPFGLSEIGVLGDGNLLTAHSLYGDYRREFLREMPVRIFYCGNEAPEALIQLLEESCVLTEGISASALSTGYTKAFPSTVKEITERAEVTQGKLNIGYRTNILPDSPDFAALYVMNAVYGGGPQSKLFLNVREKNSLAYYASSRLERLKGIMLVGSGIDIRNKERAQALILAQLEDIQAGRITDRELAAAKAMLVHACRSCADTQFSLMDYYVAQSFLPAVTEIGDYIKQIEAVTKDDVVRVSQQVMPDTVYFLTAKEA